MIGIFYDLGRLYRWIVCKDLHVILTVRLIREAKHTNRVSTSCAGAYFSDCNLTCPALTQTECVQFGCPTYTAAHAWTSTDPYPTIFYALLRMSSEFQAHWSDSRGGGGDCGKIFC